MDDTLVADARAGAPLAELEAAYASGQPTLDDIVMARSYRARATTRLAIQFSHIITKLLETYEGSRSEEILDRHFCRYVPAGVILLSERLPIRGDEPPPAWAQIRVARIRKAEHARQRAGSIDLSYMAEASWSTDPAIEAAIWTCKGLSLEATHLVPQRRATELRSIYSVLVLLLNYADSQAERPTGQQRLAAMRTRAAEEIAQLKASLDRQRLQQARILYLAGMFSAGFIVASLIAILGFLATPVENIVLILQVAVAGATGALVSVMTRTTRGKLNVDPDADRRLILLSGGFRLLIGAIFALALFIFIEAKILPIDISVEGLQLVYFFIGVAFLAGFSERLAQDAVTRAGAVISPISLEERQSASQKNGEDAGPKTYESHTDWKTRSP